MPSASDPRQPNRTRQPASRPVPSGQRPMQPTQRAAQPAARSAQSSSCPTQPTQRPGQQPVRRPAQQSAAHTAQPAGGSRFKQQAPAQRTQGQAPQSRSHAHHAHGSHGVAPATRSSYNTRARRGAQKKSSPVPMIIGGVVAVLALVAIVFFVVPAVKGFLLVRMRKSLLASRLLSLFPMVPRVTASLRFSPRTISSKIPRIITRRSKSSTPTCRSSPAPTRSPRSWTRPRSFSSSWRAPMRAPMH